MVATLNQNTTTTQNANTKTNARSRERFAESFLTVSRLGDLHEDETMEALRRAAAIRKTWSDQEIAKRQQVGQQRRDELSKMLSGATG